MKPGVCFIESEKRFKYNQRWVDEDEMRNVDDRTAEEILKAMNCINKDLKFTLERESDFPSKRLPTLSFEIWSCKDGIHHSYFEKLMRSQILTMKRSAQSENSKNAILTNELNRRFLMMDRSIGEEERTQKVDQFTQQLVNSGYSWAQTREIIVSSLKGIVKRERREIETGAQRYRASEESLEERIKKRLTEPTEWYKKVESKLENDVERERDKEMGGIEWEGKRTKVKWAVKRRKKKKEEIY